MKTISLPVIYQRDGNTTPNHCRECGGRCCQNAPGIALPSDFGPRETLADTILSYLKTRYWSVDWWEGDTEESGHLYQVYYVRPATLYCIGKVRDPSWGGPCALWSEEYGCSLQFENRPHECRHLRGAPLVNGERNCVGEDKEWYVKQWRPFQEEVIEAMNAAMSDQPTGDHP